MYDKIPEVKHALNGLYSEIELPMPAGYDALDRFQVYNAIKMMNQIDEAKADFFAPIEDEELRDMFDDETIELYETMGEIFDDQDQFEDVFPNYKKLKDLASELKSDLQEEGRFEKFEEVRNDKNLKTQLWITSISNLNQFSIELVTNPVKIIGTSIELNWSILTYSYLRDFELFMSYIIDPVLDYDFESDSYIDKIKAFCETEEAMRVYSELLNDYMKPAVRSRIAHQMYYVDPKENKVVFIVDPNWKDSHSIDKEYSIEKLNQLAWNMNLLLWTALSIVYENQVLPINPQDKSFLKQSELKKLEGSDLFEKIKTLPVFTGNLHKIHSEILKRIGKYPDEATIYPYPFYESVLVFKLFFNKIFDDNQIFSWIQMGSKMLYLVAYTLLEERSIKPVVKAIKNNANLGKMRDKKLLKIWKKYKDGKYMKLVRSIDPDVRNAIAHMNYYLSVDNIFKFEIDQNIKHLRYDGLRMMNLYYRLEMVFDSNLEKIPLYIGLGKLFDQLMFKLSINHDEVDSAFEIMTAWEIDFGFEILIPCMVISKIQNSSMKFEFDDINDAIGKYVDAKNEFLEFLWSIVFYHLCQMKGKIRNGLMQIIDHLRKPSDSKIVWKIHAVYYFSIGNDLKGAEFLQKSK